VTTVCEACGATNAFAVDASGRGIGFSLLGVTDDESERDAAEVAEDSLLAAARRRAALRRCPACRAIPVKARRRHVVVTLALAALIIAPFGGLAWFLGAKLHHHDAAALAAVIGFGFALKLVNRRYFELHKERRH